MSFRHYLGTPKYAKEITAASITWRGVGSIYKKEEAARRGGGDSSVVRAPDS